MPGPLSTMTPRGDIDVMTSRLPAESPPPDPSWLEAAGANWRLNEDDSEEHQVLNRMHGYGALADELVRRGYPKARYGLQDRKPGVIEQLVAQLPGVNGGTEVSQEYEDQIWADVVAVRKLDPGAFPGIPQNREEFNQLAARRMGRRDQDQRIAARGGLGTSLVPGLGYGLAHAADPENLLQIPMGGGGRSVGGILLRQFGAGAAGTVLTTPERALARAQMGESYSGDNLLADAVLGGVTNAGFVGLHMGGARLGKLAYEQMPLDYRLARQLTREVPQHLMPPELSAAVHVVERGAEVDASNPYPRSYDGLEAHGQRLQAAIDQFDALPQVAAPPPSLPRAQQGAPPPAPRGPPKGQVGFDNFVYQGLRQRGVPEHVARGVAAGVHAESASNPHVRGGYKGRALGYGQWLGPRRAEIIRRYGENPTPDQQLDFLVWELNGGDGGGRAVLSARDEVGALDAYINQFMRPAKGAETSGDMKRGMAALGRGGEDMPGGASQGAAEAALVPFPDRPAALDAPPVEVEMPRGFEAPPGNDLPVQVSAPQLRRELFDSDEQWKMAQAASDARFMGVEHSPVEVRQQVWVEARDRLLREREGEVRGVLFHPDTGPIDLKWGNAKGGLAHIAEKHPEVLDELPRLIDEMSMVPGRSSENRITLQSADHRATVRLDWDGKQQHWLLTAFKLDEKIKAPPVPEDRGGTGMRRDRSPNAGAASDIAPPGFENKLPPDLAKIGRPFGFSEEDRIHSGFYRFETPAGPITWDPETLHANGAVPTRTGLTADDVRMLVDPSGDMRAKVGNPAAMDLAEANGELGPPIDNPQISKSFDDPAGDGIQAVADSMWHDLRAADDGAGVFDLGDGRGERAIAEIDAELAKGEAGIEAIRACMK